MNQKAPIHPYTIIEKPTPRITELGTGSHARKARRVNWGGIKAAAQAVLDWARKNAGKLSLALLVYLALLLLVAGGASIGLFFPQAVLRKVLQSDSPNIALIAFSAAAIAGLWIIFRLGLEIANFPLKFSEGTLNRFRQYPLWYPAVFLLIASSTFFSIWHPCQAPAVTFTLTTIKSSGAIQPNDVLTAAPNEMLIFSVSPVTGATIGCTWNKAGDGIAHLSQTSGCTSTVWLAPQPGAAILTVAVNEGICPNQDVYSFPIMIRKP